MRTSKRPTIFSGAVVGLLFTAPLMAVFYLGDRVAGLPFLPFDLFDWLARVLPGQIIVRTIGVMVDLIQGLNLGETSGTAKTIEQWMGLAIFLGIGIFSSAVLFWLLNRVHAQNPYPAGFAAGLVLGMAAAGLSSQVNITATTGSVLNFMWIVLTFILWGLALSWIYHDLTQMGVEAETRAAEIRALQELQGKAPDENAGSIAQMDRREFLIRVGGATATLTVISAGIGLLFDNNGDVSVVRLDNNPLEEQTRLPPDLPNADASLIPAPGTRLEYTPLDEHYRIDINLRPPRVNPDNYVLRITGNVDEERALSLDEIIERYEPVHYYITLSCISNPVGGDLIGTTKWTGIPIQSLIDDWGVGRATRYMRIHAADGFDEVVEMQYVRRDERIMLVYAWDDQPLTDEHGFPLRVFIPDRYGMKQPKWINEIEFTNEPDEGYWVRRGWSEEAIVNTTSVIDTIASTHAFEEDGITYIPIGGIAYAGARGISRVEVQIDDGTWQEAQLREPISDLTWVIWRYDWQFSEGQHRFRVRAYDGFGNLQPTDNRDTFPSGATGVHTWNKTIHGEA